jgi:hypothetical protein
MRYKIYERDRRNHFQEGIDKPFNRFDIFGSFAYIDEVEATKIRLQYPNAHMFPVKEYEV